MASTFSPSLKLELMGNGDQSGTWGTTTNTNLGTLLEQAITGVVAITMVNANYTLSNLNGASDEARNAVLVVGGTNSAVRDIIAPAVNKTYIVYNNTTGGYAVNIKTSGGTSVSVANGISQVVYCNGTDFFLGNIVTKISIGAITSFTGSEIIPVGTTAQRDAIPASGYFRFNSDSGQFEGYNGTTWGSIGGGATGGGGDTVFQENSLIVTTSYTLSTDKSAMSKGPITINAGATVTIPAGYSWLIL